uniref:VanW family protein n=1 Tax=Romboutsia ilealis TaxID=1115758 RepID=UPI002572EA2F
MGKNNIGVSQTSTLDESFYKSGKSNVKKYKIVGLMAIICVLGVSINYFNKKYIYTNVIAKNIFVEGIDVSNLTKEEAINYVNENVILGELQLNYNGETNVISPDEIDLKYNTSEVVEKAYNYTKTDSYFENVKRFFNLNKNSKNLEIKSLYNENKLSEKIQNISDSINVDMKNAKVYISDSGNISTSSATIGKELDIASTKESIYDAIKNKDYKSIDLKVNIKEPKISTEAVKSVNTLLAEFSTKFSTKDSNRVTNVVLSAKATSDVLLMPGEEFSYNNLTGKRTTSNGYKDAPVIINGKLEQDVGGGVCQVSSTLFNSVLYSGLDVTSRRNHSLKSSYVSIGRDAMVSDGGSDFRFKNPYSHPVYIKNTVSNGVIT